MQPNFEKLSSLLRGYKSDGLALIRRAYEFAEEAHEGQLRESGTPYFHHTFATALILAEWRMPPAIIAAGFLHDVPEDTKFSLNDIEKKFGHDIASIVEGETKLSSLKYRGRERYAENLRKMFFAIAKDLRVVIVKFADRIDNLKTVDIFPEEKRRRIALETLEIYAPIANRLGMGDAKGQLEDLSFPHVHPQEYAWLTKLIEGKLEDKKHRMEKVKKIAEVELERAKLAVSNLHGRTKRLYSLYRKLLARDRDLSRVYDLIALRIIVKTVADCYAVLGAIHNRFKPLKGRIKDYIAQPKPNGYRSLHTTVFSDEGEIVEFQIRTEEMHEDAEYGVAAHWRYDESGKSSTTSARQVKWMNELARIQKELHDREAFLETVEELKIDFFKNRIFIFTPKGDVIDLPEDSTPIDFAYAIHTDVGNHTSGVRVNSEMAALDTKLNSGDIVEIIVDAKRRGPSPDWLKFAKTRHARSKIKSAAHGRVTEWLRGLIPGKGGSKTKK